MGLERQPGRSPYWFGRFDIDGVSTCKSLKIKVEGTPPAKGSHGLGCPLFERSRARAQAEHDRRLAEATKTRTDKEWLMAVHEIKTGRTFPVIALADMPDRWTDKVEGTVSIRYQQQATSVHKQFVTFLKKRYPQLRFMAQVRPDMAVKFMKTIEAVGYAGGTYNRKLDYLRSAFNKLAVDAGVVANPFAAIPELDEDIVNRVPFSLEALTRILDIARRPEHAFIRVMLIVASMTAMRRADCCQLRWSSIKWKTGMIAVKAAKTKKPLLIPIAPMLMEILKEAPKTDPLYVFPKHAALFARNPDKITGLTRDVLEAAGYFNQEKGGPVPLAEIQCVRETGKGVRKASLIDFQSFRATWVTIALLHNVPDALVCKVTGHTTLDTLRKHYFLPGDNDFRDVFEKKLPVLLGGKVAADPEKIAMTGIVEKLQAMTGKNWAKLRNEMIASLLASSPDGVKA